MTTKLAFHDTKFTPVKRNNQIWLTAVEIAQALGYKKSDAVTQIYDRNSDEFREDMTETLNLSASGNYQKTVRIFSLRGAHLIAMFARTPVAKEFRRWVLDILDREVESMPTKAIQTVAGIPFPKPCRYLVTMSADGLADIKPINDDMFIGKVDQILSGLRESGWIVIKRDLLAEKMATW